MCFSGFILNLCCQAKNIIPTPTAALSEKLEYPQWLTRLKDIQFKSELMSIINLPIYLSQNNVFKSNSVRFKYIIPNRVCIILAFTGLHLLPLHTQCGSADNWKMWRPPWTITYGGGDLGKHTQISPNRAWLHYSCWGNSTTSLSFPYNPSTWIYDQGLAHLFQIITVPYHFSIQSEGSPIPKQLKRISKTWAGNWSKSCQRQSMARHQEKVTLLLAHYPIICHVCLYMIF